MGLTLNLLRRVSCMLLALASTASPAATPGTTTSAPAAALTTLTGIPLDAAWKRKLYGFAREKLLHPAWGWTHSERDFLLASRIAAKEGMRVDKDVLFAAAFTHDIGAIGEFQKEGVDHAERSAELIGSLLEGFGFPSEKLPRVREAVLGHMFDKVPARRNEAVLLHDADTLDFLGAIGVARRLSVTGTAVTYSGGVERIRTFAQNLPPRLVTNTARQMARSRVSEMRHFLAQLNAESMGVH
jgi:uncharacterized protein